MATNFNCIGGLYKPSAIAVNGNYAYVINNYNSSLNGIAKCDLTNGDVTYNYFNIYSNAVIPYQFYGISISSNYAYVTNTYYSVPSLYSVSCVNKYNLTTGGNSTSTINIQNGNYANGIAVNGNYAYVTNKYINNSVTTYSIYKYNLTTSLGSSFITSGLNIPSAIAINGTSVYITNQSSNTIGQYKLTTGEVINSSFISTGLNSPNGIAINGNYIYVTNYNTTTNTGSTSLYNLTTGSFLGYITGLTSPGGISIYENIMYVTNYENGTVSSTPLDDSITISFTYNLPDFDTLVVPSLFYYTETNNAYNNSNPPTVTITSGSVTNTYTANVTITNNYVLIKSSTNYVVSNSSTTVNITNPGGILNFEDSYTVYNGIATDLSVTIIKNYSGLFNDNSSYLNNPSLIRTVNDGVVTLTYNFTNLDLYT